MAGELTAGDVTPKAPKLIRTNGLHPPFDPLQIASWIMVALLAVCFFTALSPLLDAPWDMIATVVSLEKPVVFAAIP